MRQDDQARQQENNTQMVIPTVPRERTYVGCRLVDSVSIDLRGRSTAMPSFPSSTSLYVTLVIATYGPGSRDRAEMSGHLTQTSYPSIFAILQRILSPGSSISS